LNLEVYVFLGVVTVQRGIVCSNYKVQVANLNPPERLSDSESTFPGNILGGFGVKTNALIHPTHNFNQPDPSPDAD